MDVYQGKRLTITAGSLTQIGQHDNFTRAVSRGYRDRGQKLSRPRLEPIRSQDLFPCLLSSTNTNLPAQEKKNLPWKPFVLMLIYVTGQPWNKIGVFIYLFIYFAFYLIPAMINSLT